MSGGHSHSYMMEYKGYIARIVFDDSVDAFHGDVANCGDSSIATFEATDVEGLRREFRLSIEEYLAACKDAGVEPSSPYSGKIDLDLGFALHHRIAITAAQDGMTIEEWVKHILEERAVPSRWPVN